jgi:hypothetical protein
VDKIKAGLGRIDERTAGWLAERYRAGLSVLPRAEQLIAVRISSS